MRFMQLELEAKEIVMPRIAPIVSGQTDAATSATLAAVKAGFGMVPSLFATVARSPTTLDAYF